MGEVRISEAIAPAFYPVHGDIKRGGHNHYWLKGGRGSTKSSFVSVEIIRGIMHTPDTHAVVYRKVADTLAGTVYGQCLWAIHRLGVDEYWTARKSPLELIYKPTGQKIIFRGADDPAKSKSIKFAFGYPKYLWFEELTEFDGMEAVRSILQSVIRGGAEAVIFYTYNPPKSAQNWVNAEAILPDERRYVHHSTYLDVPPQWLGDEFIAIAETLKRLNPRAYDYEYMGEVTGTGGQVFDNIEVRKVTDDEIGRFDKLYHGLDFGFAGDPDAALRMYYERSTMQLYIFGEHCASGANYDTLSSKLRELNPQNMLIYADSAEARGIAELRERGHNIIGAKKPSGSVEDGIRWLEGLAKIVIDGERCPNAAREFTGYERKKDRLGNFLAAYPDENNHTIDACRYGLEPLIKNRKVKVGDRRKLGI